MYFNNITDYYKNILDILLLLGSLCFLDIALAVQMKLMVMRELGSGEVHLRFST
jgi:hypothetical protein